MGDIVGVFVFTLVWSFLFVDFLREVVRCLDDGLDVFFGRAVVRLRPGDADERFDQFLFSGGESIQAANTFRAFTCLSSDVVPGTGEVDVGLGTLEEALGGLSCGVYGVVIHVGDGFEGRAAASPRVDGVQDIRVFARLVVGEVHFPNLY